MHEIDEESGADMENQVGVIDIHTHVLPHMDDGSKNTEMSLQMLRLMKVDAVVATPHYYGRRESVDSFLERRDHSWQKLKEHVDGTLPEIRLGAEVAFGTRLLEEPKLDCLCISGTRTLLLEMPFSQWSEMELNVVSSLCLERKYQVILAHLERFVDLQRNSDIMDQILRLPIYVQINAEAILPAFKRKRWVDMFRNGQAHLLGSDCHNLSNRKPNLELARSVLRKKLGQDLLDQIDLQGTKLLNLSLTQNG